MPENRPLSETLNHHMSDVDRIKDCLCDSKERAMLYAQGALESANNGVREFFLAMHGEETHNQEIMSSFLHTRGQYPVQVAHPDHITDVHRHFTALHDQLGLNTRPSFRRYHTADPTLPPISAEKPGAFEYKSQH